MKLSTKRFIATLIIVLILATLAIGLPLLIQQREETKRSHLQAETMMVINVCHETEIVTLKDYYGKQWVYKGAVEDIFKNDLVSCMVDNKGTVKLTDDEILDIKYGGMLKGWLE